MTLTDEDYIRLTAAILRHAADELGNRGCNDFDLTAIDGFQVPEKRRELDRLMQIYNRSPGDHDPAYDMRIGADFFIAGFLADYWKNGAPTSPPLTPEQQREVDLAAARGRVKNLEWSLTDRKRAVVDAESEARETATALEEARAELARAELARAELARAELARVEWATTRGSKR